MCTAAMSNKYHLAIDIIGSKLRSGVSDSRFDTRNRLREQWNIIIILGLLLEDRHLYRQGVPSRFCQPDTQRVDSILPVRMKTTAMQDNDGAPDRFIGCLGIDTEELMITACTCRFEEYRITIEDGIDDLIGHALFSLQVGSMHRYEGYCR